MYSFLCKFILFLLKIKLESTKLYFKEISNSKKDKLILFWINLYFFVGNYTIKYKILYDFVLHCITYIFWYLKFLKSTILYFLVQISMKQYKFIQKSMDLYFFSNSKYIYSKKYKFVNFWKVQFFAFWYNFRQKSINFCTFWIFYLRYFTVLYFLVQIPTKRINLFYLN